MKKSLPINSKPLKAKYKALSVFLKQSTFILGLCLIFSAQSFGQITVFSDDFNRGAVVTPLSNGGTPSATYLTKSLSAAGTNAANQGTSTTSLNLDPDYSLLLIGNTTTPTAARTYVTSKLSSYNSAFNPILDNNSATINWSFNMRTNRSTALTADAFSSGSWGGAVVLCCDKEDYLDATAKGYVVYMSRGTGTTTNQIILARFNGGLSAGANVTTMASSAALTALTNYVSVKVTFNPIDHNWSLFVRDDGTSVFLDPSNVTTQAGSSIVNQTNTTSAMTDFGFFWNHNTSTPTSNTFRFDNFKVSINTPTINAPSVTSLSGFTGTSTVASAEQSFTISGQYLTNSIVITAPSSAWEMSTTSGSYAGLSTITLTNSATVANTPIYIRLKSGQSDGSYTGNITITTSGSNANTRTVSLNGTVSSSPTLSLSASSLAQFTSTAAGAQSSSKSFTISGANLTSNVVLNAPTNFQVSNDDLTFSSSINVSPSGGFVNSTIYARYSPSGSGSYTGNLTIYNAEVNTTQNVALIGYLSAFYYKGSGDLALASNWSGTSDLTGTSQPDFVSAGATHYINTNATTVTPWTVAGTNSKIVLGDATKAGVTLNITSGAAITTTSPVVLDITAASSSSNILNLGDATTKPTLGTLDNTSEVHYAITMTHGASSTFGKLIVDNGSISTMTGIPIIKTSVEVPSGATLATGNLSTNYIVVNSGASVLINGSFKTEKSTGLVSSGSAAISSNPAIQFIGTEQLTLGSNSTIEFARSASGTTQTITPRSDYKNLTLSGDGNNKSLSGTNAVSGNLTINSTGTSALSVVAGATLTVGGSIIYNGTAAQKTFKDILALVSSPKLVFKNTVGVSLEAANSIADDATIDLSGGQLNTGSFAETLGTLSLSDNSTIALGTGVHALTFAASNSATWTSAKTLTITGWTGTAGASGTAGQIFIGSSASGLTAQQISQITFTGFANGATLLSTGELVPSAGVLPVQLLSFTGKKANQAVQLSWSTASEKNNLRFDILRSGSDKIFQKIGEVNGNGNSNATLYYNFSDRNPITGINYYQLNQVDYDGKAQVYDPIAITSAINPASLAVFAHSDQSELVVILNSDIAKQVEVSVYDLSGRQVVKQKVALAIGSNQFSLAASTLTKGIHILKISSKEGTLVKKFTY